MNGSSTEVNTDGQFFLERDLHLLDLTCRQGEARSSSASSVLASSRGIAMSSRHKDGGGVDGAGGWPLGLEPVHLKKRVLDTVVEDQDPASSGIRAKISTTSYSDETSNLETESSCSSRFFPDDKPVTLGEILGMSLNHLATNSFRSIELHVADSSSRRSSKSATPWSSMMRCRCSRASTTSSRFDDSDEVTFPDRIYTNSIFEQEQEEEGLEPGQGGGGGGGHPVSLQEHFRSSSSSRGNPLFLVDYAQQQRH